MGGDGAREGSERPGPSPAARLTRCRAKCPPPAVPTPALPFEASPGPCNPHQAGLAGLEAA